MRACENEDINITYCEISRKQKKQRARAKENESERDGNHKIEKDNKTLIDYCFSCDIWMDG